MGKIIEKHIDIYGVSKWFWDDKDTNGWDAPLEDWQNGLREAIIEYVPNKGTVVQAGGMLGMYPRLMADIFNNVITFEPNKYNYEILSLNCNKENIKHYNVGLSNKNGTSEMICLSDINLGMKLIPNEIIPKYGYEETLEKIDITTIDTLELDSCDLIQLDIERHEIFALTGAMATITKFKPVIIVECNIEDKHFIENFMDNANYVAVKRLKNDVVYIHKDKIKKEIEMKNILIAIPTNKEIENDTTKSISNLIIPQGYSVKFEYFYGYAIDQVRNLIASYTVRNNFDYVFCVDSDIVLPPDALVKLLSADKHIVSGVYRQRKFDVNIPELFLGLNVVEDDVQKTLCFNMTREDLGKYEMANGDCFEIEACGFGCVLIKREVFEKLEEPHFFYKHSIDFKDTISEDVYFCQKAAKAGFKTHFIPSLKLGHIAKLILYV